MKVKKLLTSLVLVCLSVGNAVAHQEKKDNSSWWDKDWWSNGVIKAPANHKVKITNLSFSFKHKGEEIEMPVMVARPADGKNYPGVLFVHGRAGLSDLIRLHVKRLAARGFVVYAPDMYTARFIERPIRHDTAIEYDLNQALNFMLRRGDFKGKRVCTYSHTRGGYKTLKLAVTFKRQVRDVACYVSYYPHWQDPNAPEPEQVYSYAKQVDAMKIPIMVFIGEHEQYQRRRGIEEGFKALKRLKRDATLFIYPGVGRGFDFKREGTRTFADDLATKDAIQRAARFMRKHLK